jgi:hypothetical protein
MGIARIGKVINHNIKSLIELITETYKGFNQKGILYNSSGDDSPPIKEDRVFLVKSDGTGQFIIIGTLTLSQGAKPGEKIFFARDQKGNIVSKIKMLNNGDYIFDSNSETTGEATGNYSQDIKGNHEAEILKDNEVVIHGNRTVGIEEDDNLEVAGDYTINVAGDLAWSIGGNLAINVVGTVNINAGGTIKINGAIIRLN